MKEQNKTKKKQKMTAAEILTLVLLLLIGAACGILAVEYADPFSEDGGGLFTLLLLFIGLYFALCIQLILHEAGHLLFGLLSGYRFVSFRIFSLILIKQNGRFRLRRFSIAGTAGQCLMSPPDMQDGRIPVVLYNLGGVILNFATALLFLALFLVIPESPLFSPFLLFLTIFGLVFALQNGIPMRAGPVDNDGKNALSLGKNPAAMRALWIQLKLNEQIALGLRLSEMPAEWFALPKAEEMENPLIASLAVFAAERYMDEHRFAEADAMISSLLTQESGLVGLHRAILSYDGACLALLDGRTAVLDTLLGQTEKQLLKQMKGQPTALRTEYFLALLLEKDEKKAAAIRAAFDKCARTYPYPNDLALDRELMDKADELYAA